MIEIDVFRMVLWWSFLFNIVPQYRQIDWGMVFSFIPMFKLRMSYLLPFPNPVFNMSRPTCKHHFFELTITFATCDMRSLCPVGKCQEFTTIFRFLSLLLTSNWDTVILSAMLIPLFLTTSQLSLSWKTS